LALYHNIF
jgi:hypothetical protein